MYLGSSGEWKMDKACCQGNLWPAEVSLRCAILSKVLSDHTSYDPKGHSWDRTPRNAGAVTVHTHWQLRQVTPKRSQYSRQNWPPPQDCLGRSFKSQDPGRGMVPASPAAPGIYIHVHIFTHVDVLLHACAHEYCCA